MRWLSVSYFINEKRLFLVHLLLIIFYVQLLINQLVKCHFLTSKTGQIKAYSNPVNSVFFDRSNVLLHYALTLFLLV